MTRLLLARHASHAVVHRVLSGRAPEVRLSEAGRTEAALLARRVARERPAALYTSPQPRAQETAAAFNMPSIICTELDEVDFGEWRGRAFEDLEADPRWRAWNAHRATARAPGGEAMHEVASRALRWIETLPARHPGAVVAAVSHADVIRAALCLHLGLSLDAIHRFDVAPASLSAIELWPGGGRVTLINERPAAAEEQHVPPSHP